MPDLSTDTIATLLRIAFLVGAITDGLAIIPMLSRRVSSALFGGDPARPRPEYRYAMGLGASLMAGWTVLLLWGAVRPIERRDLLLITVFPVLTGIVIATAVAVRRGVVLRRRITPLWIHLGIVSAFYIAIYVLSVSAIR
jgi:hypothetical protein